MPVAGWGQSPVRASTAKGQRGRLPGRCGHLSSQEHSLSTGAGEGVSPEQCPRAPRGRGSNSGVLGSAVGFLEATGLARASDVNWGEDGLPGAPGARGGLLGNRVKLSDCVCVGVGRGLDVVGGPRAGGGGGCGGTGHLREGPDRRRLHFKLVF